MKAATLTSPQAVSKRPLRIGQVAQPAPKQGQILLRVRACGVCRTDLHAAPLLCAGIIGFRSLRVAGVEPGERVGLFGFGASAHLAITVLRSRSCEVYVSTRGARHRELATSLGAVWVGSEKDRPPVELDRAVTFAPSGDVVIAALSSLRKGGVVAINAIHLDRIP